MLQLRGTPALSAFRLEKFLATLQAQVPSVSGLHAEYMHFIDTELVLDQSELATLGKILEYGPGQQQSEASDGLLMVVLHAG